MASKTGKFLLRRISRRNLKTLLRYTAEIFIIFAGITISFAFEQWREDRRRKDELIALTQSLLNETKTARRELVQDQPESALWIARMDSIRVYGPKKMLSAKQLDWFYQLVTGQFAFLFEAHSPTFRSVIETSYWNEFPDTIRSEIYKVYNNKLQYAALLYDQQQENITHFRLSLIASKIPLAPVASPVGPGLDYAAFSNMPMLESWENFANQVLITEKKCYQQNEAAIRAMQELEGNLTHYLKQLRD